MNFILGIFASLGIAYCIKRFRELSKEVIEEQKTVSISAETILFFMSICEIIRIVKDFIYTYI